MPSNIGDPGYVKPQFGRRRVTGTSKVQSSPHTIYVGVYQDVGRMAWWGYARAYGE